VRIKSSRGSAEAESAGGESTMSAPQRNPLQFETAGTVAATAAVTCATCQRTVPDTYFEADGQVLCTGCKDAALASRQGGSGLVRALSALALGVLAATVSAVAWYLIVELTGFELGIVAVGVGVLVGAAVRAGAKGRGGVLYQALAIVLTYLAIASSYVPPAVEAFRAHAQQEVAAGGEEPSAEERRALDTVIVATAVFFALTWPVMQVTEGGFIGLLILGFALYEAWKLNRRGQLAVQGPFRVAATSAS